jgi:hypothetical protein
MDGSFAQSSGRPSDVEWRHGLSRKRRLDTKDMPDSEMSRSIYVQIPAYKDRELLPTVRDLMRTARNPGRLRVAIAWQYGEGEEHLEQELRQAGNVELVKIRADESQGCNWARSLLQRRWSGEAYTLLLDSHHRLTPDWDEQLIAIYEGCRARGSEKPLITSYLPPYDPHRDPQGRTRCIYKIHVEERIEGMAFRLTGHAVPNWECLAEPVPASFVSLHCLFAAGSFNREIEFDPSIYFFCDEVAIALRAYTSGYDLFHPHRILGWHLYDRTTRVPHWEDHSDWRARHGASCRRLRDLFQGRAEEYGAGSVRSIAEYERWIGTPLLSDV